MGHTGLPASQSLEKTNAIARSAQGKKGGVIRLAYITAVVPAVGQNLASVVGSGAPPMQPDEVSSPPLLTIRLSYIQSAIYIYQRESNAYKQDGWLEQTDHAATASFCLNSIPLSEGIALSKAMFGHHSAVSFGDALTYAGYRDAPVSWFFCEEDRCVRPEVQQVCFIPMVT
jgi:hypothetical protein